jgi:hypothetical protein
MRVRTRSEIESVDSGSALIMALIMVIVGSLIILPLLEYTMTVTKSNRTVVRKALGAESVKGGLRAALFDPSKLYTTCAASGWTTEVQLAVPPGLDISSHCTLISAAQQYIPSNLRYALTTTQVGSQAAIPAPYVADPGHPELNGTMDPSWCTSLIASTPTPCGRAYPYNGDVDTSKWWRDYGSAQSAGDKVFFPPLPANVQTDGYAAGFAMPLDPEYGACRVYFPGHYRNDVVISGPTKTYFVSGIYYFDKTLRITGNANVVIGSGFYPGCVESDLVAAGDALDDPNGRQPDISSSGVGATLVFGKTGRLLIDDTGTTTGLSIKLNRRQVETTAIAKPLDDISIMTVNGRQLTPTSPIVDLDTPGLLNVPRSMVLNKTLLDLEEAPTHSYAASSLESGLAPPVPCGPPPAVPASTCPVIDIQLNGTAPVSVVIPGYVAAPQGSISVSTATPAASAQKSVAFSGGILAAQMAVSANKPASLQLGLLNPVAQRTFRVVTSTNSSHPKVVSDAIVQINETGGYAVNSWVIRQA